jgi:hypothetical protein
MAHLTRIAVLLCLAAGLDGIAAAAELPLESAVKASYLYKFAPFVQWPATAFDSAGAPLSICIAGPNPFGTILADAVRGRRVNGHPIVLRQLDTVPANAPCHIVFADGDDAEDALRAVAHQPVLTVTDRSAGITGGMIQFVMIAGRVRFTIDQSAAQNSGIAISSKLLGLAVSVTR